MTHDGDVPDKLWEGGHIEEEALVKSCLWHILFFDDPLPRLYRSDNRLGKGLGIFLLDESLDILAIYIGCGWVILFIFV